GPRRLCRREEARRRCDIYYYLRTSYRARRTETPPPSTRPTSVSPAEATWCPSSTWSTRWPWSRRQRGTRDVARGRPCRNRPRAQRPLCAGRRHRAPRAEDAAAHEERVLRQP